MKTAALGEELLSMAEEDLRVREELARDGSLFEGYHPRMREVHERNADRLLVLLHEYGWPSRSLVGESGMQAAWLIVQHAISRPSLQRHALTLLKSAAAAGEFPMLQVAMLEDRIRCNEGNGQRYGTQYDWDKYGQMSPLPIEDTENVDVRRSEVGLGPLASEIRNKREQALREGEQPPRDWQGRQRNIDAWLRSVGWRQ